MEQVLVEQAGHVLRIGVNRADKRNAWNLAVISQVAAAYERLAADPQLRVGLVHGVGAHFSAGLDLAEVGPVVARGGPQKLFTGSVDPFGLWGPPCPKPVVLAVQGIAYTLSIELALAADVVVAAEDVRFAQLEVSRGILPFGGATFRAAQSLGWGNAMSFLLTGSEFGAEEARRIGLVQKITPVGEQFAAASEIAETIAAQAPLPVQATLANARVARAAAEAAAREHLASALPPIMASTDAAEGLRSFAERRSASFQGA
ncbi:MAG: crotonase/enoyl-CoA hydratase family protein [Candidatus Nanopelagicales bacterium]